MNGKEVYSPRLSSTQAPRAVAAWHSCLALLTLMLLLAMPVAAQPQQKPNIADDVDDKKTLPRDVDSKPPKESRPPVRRTGSVPPRRALAPAALPVTFLTSLPGAEVFLNREPNAAQKLGRTGADGRLFTKLPRGRHTVTASRPGARIVRQQIDVQPGRTTFSLNLSGQGGAFAAGVVRPVAVTAEQVFTRFLDPRQTDGVTLADWQSAQAQTAAAYSQNGVDPLNAAQAMFAHGQVAYLRGDYATALASFNNSALALPNSALAFYGLGNAYLATGQLSEASRAYQQAIKINKDMALAHRGMGDVLAKQGKDKEALVYYEAARIRGYSSPALDQMMARSLLRQKQWQRALNILLVLARTRPSAEVLIGIGDAYVGIKQPMSAAGAYRQATQHDPRSALAHFKHGELSYQLREYAAAMEALERALALDPTGASFNRKQAREMADAAARKLSRKN